jgi:hypothetical protein
MPRTTAIGDQIRDGSIQRIDLDAATPGAAVVRRLIAGTNVTLTSTGPDSGTGDVTISAASGGSATPIDWVGGVSGALPSVPASGTVKESSYQFAGHVRATFSEASGEIFSNLPRFDQKSITAHLPTTSNAMVAVGSLVGTTTGTATTRAISIGNTLLLTTKRVGFVSAATVGALAGYRFNAGFLYLTNLVNRGGFFCTQRFGIAAITADARMFAGFTSNTAAPTNVEPNTVPNSIGVCKLAALPNLQFVTRNVTTATTTDLGANFPASVNAVYEIGMFALPNSSLISFYVRRLDVPQYVEFIDIATNAPAINTLLTFNNWICNNATAAAVALDQMAIYTETSR